MTFPNEADREDQGSREAFTMLRRADGGLLASWKMAEFLHFQMCQQERVKRERHRSD